MVDLSFLLEPEILFLLLLLLLDTAPFLLIVFFLLLRIPFFVLDFDLETDFDLLLDFEERFNFFDFCLILLLDLDLDFYFGPRRLVVENRAEVFFELFSKDFFGDFFLELLL